MMPFGTMGFEQSPKLGGRVARFSSFSLAKTESMSGASSSSSGAAMAVRASWASAVAIGGSGSGAGWAAAVLSSVGSKVPAFGGSASPACLPFALEPGSRLLHLGVEVDLRAEAERHGVLRTGGWASSNGSARGWR